MVTQNKIEYFVDQTFPEYGVNRRQEVVRLLFEISKRDQCSHEEIVGAYSGQSMRFMDFKKYLIQKRYPKMSDQKSSVKFLHKKLELDPNLKIDLNIQPETFTDIFIEENASDYPLIDRMKKKFPKANYHSIGQYKDTYQNSTFLIQDYNQRSKKLSLIKERFDFYKSCPCSNNSIHCGYNIVNLGSGCPLECSYCYLQNYINSPGIVIPANIEDFFDTFKKLNKDIKVGSGELTDSLVYDHLTEYSPLIVDFFKDYPRSIFEFKTKTNNIEQLLKAKPNGNIVVSWSMNPAKIIHEVENYTASLEERLEAACNCLDVGYKVAFHFDPIIYYENWKHDYDELINTIFDTLGQRNIAWISLGTLRMTPRLKNIIENRFPENRILDEEFIVSHDGKLRYDHKCRTEIYDFMKQCISKRREGIDIYLCMEDKMTCSLTHSAPLKKYRNK